MCAAIFAPALIEPAAATVKQASQAASPTAVQLVTGANHTCALLPGGQVRCWGYGADGELGYPGTTTVGAGDTPAAMGPVDLGPGRTASAISAGDYHTCALLDDGSVRCWGYGGDGRLGYGNTENVGDDETPGSLAPVNLGPGRSAIAISAGGGHTCAILDDRTVRCWGYGYSGQLGYGNQSSLGDTPATTPDKQGPVDLGSGRTATAISVGGRHTCAILDDGSVRCWGNGGSGRLGYGNTDNVGDDETPGSVGPVALGTGHTAKTITTGNANTCATLDDGSLRCWGYGFSGQLGYGNQNNVGDTPADTPDKVGSVDLGLGRTATAISAGSSHTCAILDHGSVRCWGYGGDGRLGYGNAGSVGDRQTPGSVGPVDLGAGQAALTISAGGRHTCAGLDNGGVRCWGYGANGQLGYCNQRNVGDHSAPSSAGPVNLLAGDGGAPCTPGNLSRPSVSGQAVQEGQLIETHGSWSNGPTGFAYQWQRCDRAGAGCSAIAGAADQSYKLSSSDVAHTIRVQETASNAGGSGTPASSTPSAVVRAALGPDAVRARGLHACLAAVDAKAKQERTLIRHAPEHRRAQAKRALTRQLSSGRRRCLQIYGRTPGPIIGLRARRRGRTRIELDFHAPGTDGSNPPPARAYLVEQSLAPIRNHGGFARAQVLCKGACRFAVTQIGAKIALTVIHLRPDTTYYYSIAALDNVTARRGPRSRMVYVTTG